MTLRSTILTCVVAAGFSSIAPAVNGAIVRLRSSATVDTNLIHLRDIADIFADDDQVAATLQEITLVPSPIPGNTTRLQLDRIRERLLNHNVALGELEFQGSSVVTVKRRGQFSPSVSPASRTSLPTATGLASKPRSLSQTTLAGMNPVNGRTVSNLRHIPIADMRLAEAVIHDLVRDYLATWAPDWGDPIIRPLLPVSSVPAILSARNGNLKIVSGKMLGDDVFALAVDIPSSTAAITPVDSGDDRKAETTTQTVEVRVRVTRRPKVLAASRVIPQGKVIQELDLEWIQVDDLRNGTDDPRTVVGMEARSLIRPGDFVRAASVKPPTLIQRDELVKVAATFGSIRVTRNFKARRSGILNDIIDLV
ncbi:MAG: flagellar basal body P-ring formation chaperone FlgA, partial [Planctomycetota bacterium]|nr:flagellar basal body P-ring formation chaperone FlgA [Planctomycetota bacterium]